jgi:Flp pilus assembly protein TadG
VTEIRSRRTLDRHAGWRAQGGQVLVLVLLFLVVVLGMAALVIDVGYAYYAHRSLQASADAAALAGAQELPDGNRATQVANEYSGSAGGKNARENVPGVQTTVTTKCITSIPGCDPVNAVVVTEKAANVPTIFARVLGIDSSTSTSSRRPARRAASSRWTSCSYSIEPARCARTTGAAPTRGART